jgi:hypothetical protein
MPLIITATVSLFSFPYNKLYLTVKLKIYVITYWYVRNAFVIFVTVLHLTLTMLNLVKFKLRTFSKRLISDAERPLNYVNATLLRRYRYRLFLLRRPLFPPPVRIIETFR